METLILSCGTGGGHDAACAAVKQALEAKGHGATVLNPYTLRGGQTANAINHAYIALAQKAPSAFGMIYQLGNAYRRLPVSSPVYRLNRWMAPLLEDYIDRNRFDAIVTTHLFPAEILTNMKRRHKPVPKTYFIATDYTCIPFTEETDCDFYIIPARELEDEYLARGIPKERIFPLGIPVQQQFSQDEDRDEARRRLGLDPEQKYILIAGGSIGAGQIEQVVSLLMEHYQDSAELIIVCGNNQSLYQSMQKEYAGKCRVLPYTTQMADLMKACDLFLSKPGGLSSTEAAVTGTALVHITPIPGCETRNMRFFSQNGMSAAVTSPKKQLLDACDRLLDDAQKQRMCQNQHRLIHPDSALAICDLMEREFQNEEGAPKVI